MKRRSLRISPPIKNYVALHISVGNIHHFKRPTLRFYLFA
jgi:hypothetical protein